MKRPISDTLTCYQNVTHDHGLSKRRRIEDQFFPLKKKTTRVRFSDSLVQKTLIPAVADQEEKERLFYSNLDFARFAFNERVRRDALILTVAVSREQLKRMRRHAPVISSSSVSMMYHKILSRTENSKLASQRRSKSSKVTVGRQDAKQRNQPPRPDARRHIVVSRAA
mmetsp:Transcript_129183/g.192452  ORF Transcript_129183/g.192452 Transcript_129183/m.192452 type:complete len:168 (-) Transcript_129183:94-597(-)